MKILLVYPKYPDTFWSFRYALRFISKKACLPPLGLVTIASLLPSEWEKRLVDMNVEKLKEQDLKWADYVFISAMSIQEASVRDILQQCKEMNIKTVAGGPLFTTQPDSFPEVDHLVLNEAEVTLPPFIADLKKGRARHIYTSDQHPDIRKSPVPQWDLLNMRQYATMNIQYSRGCPFNCEFCNIVSLYGRTPRTKDSRQILDELESLYNKGWRGGVFFVDDNFIGNKKKLKQELLPALIQWMDKRKHPFTFSTEASIDLSDDEELMRLMVQAGFQTVFLGIESPHEESLAECDKHQNKNRDLLACIQKIQKFGLQVQGGFIVGFDSDPTSIFERLIHFIQESGIVVAMVGLLNAPRGTRLYQRLKREGRIIKDISGDNTDFTMNFIPRMDPPVLMEGYKRVLQTIYSPDQYYKRVIEFLKTYNPLPRKISHFKLSYIGAFFKSILLLGALEKERVYYWKLFFWSLLRRPKLFPMAIALSIYGFHFRKIFENNLSCLKS